jgi:hypothetical protein
MMIAAAAICSIIRCPRILSDSLKVKSGNDEVAKPAVEYHRSFHDGAAATVCSD